ncbi:serine/threonine-protein kinase [Nocardia sp. NPDC059240]|uniref:serine/threonine-protein kinase n=1 Tax=Nocardia sp. NPDC059240 TaxID=3346786 RepID=UPI0036C8408F
MRRGEVFAGYRIVGELGTGGMGEVYLARHPRLPRLDALKVLSANGVDDEFRGRFLREAELAARLRHPNVVTIYDRGEFEGRLWIAMQYVPGKDAARLLRDTGGPLPLQQALRIVEQAARGLDAAHAAGLLHRDVKPANILVAADTEGTEGTERVMVADFGIARAAAESHGLTREGQVLATINYAAPEQLSGERVDARADVYALGCTLFHLVTGAVPFARRTVAEVIYAHLHEPPPRPSRADPALPEWLDAVVARAMAKNPADRFASCGELAAAAAGMDTGTTNPPARRGRRVWAVAAVLTLALASASGVAVWQWNRGHSTATAISPATVTPTTSGSSGPWGVYGFVVDRFPDLLPPTPVDTGYRGIRCLILDSTGQALAGSLSRLPGDFALLTCSGDRDPLSELTISCNAKGVPMQRQGVTYDLTTTSGDEPWHRQSGSGEVKWGLMNTSTGPEGKLIVNFDDPARNSCVLEALSDLSSPQELHDTWWQHAPI